MWDILIRHDAMFTPECARIAAVDGTAVATAVVLPRLVRTRDHWVKGAEITLVGCRSSFQGRGYGSMVTKNALSYMKERGMALGVLYGEPGYYPRFGCAPVFASYRADLSLEQYRKSAPKRTHEILLAPVTREKAHIPALFNLYMKDFGAFPGAVYRSKEAWEWNPRDPRHWEVWILPDQTAYAVSSHTKSQDSLCVEEAAASNSEAALRLLDGLMTLAEESNRANLHVALPPLHPLHRAMAAFGARCTRTPATAGFAVVTDWTSVLPSGYARTEEGLSLKGRLILKADTISLTQLVMGYKDIDDLLYMPGCSLAEGALDGEAKLRLDFPRLTPHYMYSPFYRLR